MVNALVKINENTNRVLSIVKAENNLKDKGEAIDFIVHTYVTTRKSPEIRPEYLKKLEKIKKGKYYTRAEMERRLNNV
jgi:hypothetical protein